MTITWPISPAVLGDSRSTSRPMTKRRIAPARIGVATISPRCWVVSCRSAAICTASGPSRYQTMKLRSKYRKAANRVGTCPDFQKLVFIEHLVEQGRKRKRRRHPTRLREWGCDVFVVKGATAVGYLSTGDSKSRATISQPSKSLMAMICSATWISFCCLLMAWRRIRV
ncbi:hypothetical protein D3C80_1298020 [compost metagenome]